MPGRTPNQELVRVSVAKTEEEIGNCYEAMRVLRAKLDCRESFVARVRCQQEDAGYVLLAALSPDNLVVGVAGFRPQQNLMHGLHLYVDDLVTVEAWRNRGIGVVLMDAIKEQAYAFECRKILLDTGRENEQAHRFYTRLGFFAKALRFSLELN